MNVEKDKGKKEWGNEVAKGLLRFAQSYAQSFAEYNLR
jgi:hypothetical protein